MKVTLILAATNPALGIGRNGGLPWRLKKEMKYFKEVTQGSTVIMGRKTWESIPEKFRPLPNRQNVVISRSKTSFGSGVLSASSLQDVLDQLDPTKPVFVMGGAQIYSAALPFADRILLTLIEDPEKKLECDTFFSMGPEWKQQPESRLRELVSVDLPPNNIEIENGIEFKYTVWEK